MGHCVRFVSCGQQPRPSTTITEFKDGGTVQRRIASGLVACTEFAIDIPHDRRSSDNEIAARQDNKRRRLIEEDPMAAMERQR